MNISGIKSTLTDRQRSLLAYWVSICQCDQLPSRKELNPAQLGGALANTSLAEKTVDKFRFRLTGSRIQALFGNNAQGRLLDGIDASIAEAGTSSMELALETGRPVSGSRQIGARWHCWLRVPLLDDAGNKTLVLCLDEFPSRQPTALSASSHFEGDMIERNVA